MKKSGVLIIDVQSGEYYPELLNDKSLKIDKSAEPDNTQLNSDTFSLLEIELLVYYDYFERSLKRIANINILNNTVFEKAIICIPKYMRKAAGYKDVMLEYLKEYGFRELEFIPRILALGAGTGLDVNSSKANIVIEIGKDYSDFALYESKILKKYMSINISNDFLIDSISNIIKEKYGTIINDMTVETVLEQLLEINPKIKLVLEIRGRDKNTLKPKVIEAVSQELQDSLNIYSREIENSVSNVLHSHHSGEMSGSDNIYADEIHVIGQFSKLFNHKNNINIANKIYYYSDPLIILREGFKLIIDDEKRADDYILLWD